MQIKYAFAYSLGGRCMICQDFSKLWKSLAFRCRRFYVQKEWLFLEKQVLLNFSRVFQGKGMSTTPLWLVQNVRLPDREGLWQIAIENGRFGAITPMDETHSESYEVLNARGGLAIPPFIEPHIHLDTTQTAGEPHWNQSGTLFEGIERWRSVRRCSAMKMSKRAHGKR